MLTRPEREVFIINALQSYSEAERIAQLYLPPSNPSRIFNALNQSILLAHLLQMKNTALRIAQNAYTDAMNDADNIPNNARAKLGFNKVMHILSDNIVSLRFDVVHQFIDPILPPLDHLQRIQARANLAQEGILQLY